MTSTFPPEVRVDGATLWSDILALGALTDPARPYTRRSFSALFMEGRAWLTARMREAGLEPRIDASGNLIGRRAGADPGAGTLLVGSHSDSVPSGGRFDGMAGVVAGLAIARALRDHGITLAHALEVVDFLAEEPSEYGLSCIGSRGMSGHLTAAHLALKNEQGSSLAEALNGVGGDSGLLPTALRRDVRAAFELHIEQGPVLEAEQLDVGIVTAIVGITRIEIEFIGTAGHAGTTPMTRRRDPLIAAASLIGWIRDTAEAFAHGTGDLFVATVGVMEVLPGASNVIPKSARLVIDLRGDRRDAMQRFRELLDARSLAVAVAAQVERRTFEVQSDTHPTRCDAGLQRLLQDGAGALCLTHRFMASGAGHDMAFIAHIAPVSMVFIPCKDGRSHTPEEWASESALAAGSDLILRAILRVDVEGRTARERPNGAE